MINNIKKLKNVIKKIFFGKKVIITFFKKPSFYDFESWPCHGLQKKKKMLYKPQNLSNWNEIKNLKNETKNEMI